MTNVFQSPYRHLGHITGHRSYYLRGAGAQLERALVKYTLERLVKRHNFQLISVPDIIKANVFVSVFNHGLSCNS